jgi:uncharacterized protein
MARGWLAAGALLLAAALPAAAERRIPALTGPVVDEAGLLDAGWERRLADLSRAARAGEGGTGVQLQYLLVPSLEGEAIESFSMRAAEAWKLGTRGKDNGVLVVVARDDRRVRIEVGGGVEGGLTDAQSGRIIRNTITPAFRQGRYGEGLYRAGQEILAALGSLPQGVEAPRTRGAPVEGLPFPVGLLVGLLLAGGAPLILGFIIVALVLRAIFGRRRGFGGGFGGPWVGGGGGGWSGGGGGGGWSGGGGGFSGGGASGSW